MYNGVPADTDVLLAGTRMWRIYEDGKPYSPDSFNPCKRDLVDARNLDLRKVKRPDQGRFDPVHDPAVCPGGAALGKFLYVGLGPGAVVGEGILRDRDIPVGPIPRAWVHGLGLVELEVTVAITVAVLDDQASLLKINQDSSLTSYDSADYAATRVTCTNLLVETPTAFGVRYQCRNGLDERAAMLIDRGSTEMPIRIVNRGCIDEPGWAQETVEKGLFESYGRVFD
ncbi:hypothetical protein ERC79_10745 [Rhodococcus sp. ABRD24]|uniref:hypothetical protein n=1 Tax=Rhodococcus sp. ABRD24 TaxID=2507582 RepID=UPI001040D6E5|nr:hypothetical protein [Rhodococcus sp. ABRD24]QBJ96391.1 hypothetical protein ERC79_10745 [Rhodococcus sp. ABRD24]